MRIADEKCRQPSEVQASSMCCLVVRCRYARRDSAACQCCVHPQFAREQALPEEFIIDLDFEDIQLVEKATPNLLGQVRAGAGHVVFWCFDLNESNVTMPGSETGSLPLIKFRLLDKVATPMHSVVRLMMTLKCCWEQILGQVRRQVELQQVRHCIRHPMLRMGTPLMRVISLWLLLLQGGAGPCPFIITMCSRSIASTGAQVCALDIKSST